tara:strand:- start:159 stop:572 length:414 start_codon:yes stop_codon:yes gene_type:complete
MSDNKNNIVSLDSYRGTHLEKSYLGAQTPDEVLASQVNRIATQCNEGFAKSEEITEEVLSKSFDQLDAKIASHVEKSESNMTLARTGELGSYSYELVEKSEKAEAEETERAEEADEEETEKAEEGEEEEEEEEEEGE